MTRTHREPMWAYAHMNDARQIYACETITPKGSRISSVAQVVWSAGERFIDFTTEVDGPDVLHPMEEWTDELKYHASFEDMIEFHARNVEMLS